MAQSIDIKTFTATIPAGTAEANPTSIDIAIPAATVQRIRCRIPPGPRGQMGFVLSSGGQTVIPSSTGTWLIADDEIYDFEYPQEIDSGAWQVTGYNTGTYDHSVYVTFWMVPIGLSDAWTSTQPIPAAQLSS